MDLSGIKEIRRGTCRNCKKPRYYIKDYRNGVMDLMEEVSRLLELVDGYGYGSIICRGLPRKVTR